MNWVAACAKDSPVGKGIQEDGKRNVSGRWLVVRSSIDQKLCLNT